MANITGILTTNDLSTQLKPDIASAISVIVPWYQNPLTSLLFKANFFNQIQEAKSGAKMPSDLMTVEKTANQSFSDFETEVLGVVTAVVSGSAVGSAVSTNNVLVVSDATIFKAGDTVMISAVSTGARREFAYIYSVNYSTNTLTLTRNTVWGALSSAIAATDLVYLVANAAGQGSGTPSILTPVKTKVTNYVQNFKTTIGFTEQQQKSQYYTENEKQLQKKLALAKMLEEMESAFMQGVPSFEAISDASGYSVNTTGGIFNGIRENGGTATDAGASITKSEVDALIETTTQYGQSTKGLVMMCDPTAMKDMQAILDGSDYHKNLNPGSNVVGGNVMTHYKTAFTADGGIPLIMNPAFARKGIKGLLLLDLDTIKVKEFIPFRSEKIVITEGKQQEKDGILGEYGLSRTMFKKNGYLKTTGSTEPIA